VLTDNRERPPCCLPGTFADHNNPHGPCLPYYPCACSTDVCSRAVETPATQGGAISGGGVVVEQITNLIHVHMNVKDLQSETNVKIAEVKSMLAEFLDDTREPSSSASPSPPTWDSSLSATQLPNTTDIPAWNQQQYKHCHPPVSSADALHDKSLIMKTGGLGNLIEEGKYETWVCLLNDPCALRGDFYFCYVIDESTKTFVPWDQHSTLKLFQTQDLKTELALFALESLSKPASTLQQAENCANTPVQSFGQPEYKRCRLMWSWDDLYAGHANKSISFRMGTVGKWMQPGKFETYVCVEGHPCVTDLSDNHFCFVWSEVDEVFVPWGPNSVLKLLDTPLSEKEEIVLKAKLLALQSLVVGWSTGENGPAESTTTSKL